MSTLSIPLAVMTDSYKSTHWLQYPPAQLMVAYSEFRTPFNHDGEDSRFVYYGIRHIITTYLEKQWSIDDVELAEKFYSTHNAGFTPFPFPKDLFLQFIHENNGYFPITIQSLQEGTVAPIHTPVIQIFAHHHYARLITYMETLLTQVWYPSTVATLSRRIRETIEHAFERSVDDSKRWMIEFKLHDFGFRGCTCVEQSVIGGCAHLLSFSGSDTMSAAFHAQFQLNNGRPIAQSIPATEHSVMTSWKDESQAIINMINKFGGEGKVFAVVMDSYDYTRALTHTLPQIAQYHKKKGGILVVRPDSGDPVECILEALREGEKIFGITINSKGYKVINSLQAIQGDGINADTIKDILEAVIEAKYSVECVAFGMGGGLLQKVNRDTMSFATKLSYVIDEEGKGRDIMKRPKTDGGKTSLPGILSVKKVNGKLMVCAREWKREDEIRAMRKISRNLNERKKAIEEEIQAQEDDELKIVYDHGPVQHIWANFSDLKSKLNQDWKDCPRKYDCISEGVREKMKSWITAYEKRSHEEEEKAIVNS